jgi:hypothetical protein
MDFDFDTVVYLLAGLCPMVVSISTIVLLMFINRVDDDKISNSMSFWQLFYIHHTLENT